MPLALRATDGKARVHKRPRRSDGGQGAGPGGAGAGAGQDGGRTHPPPRLWLRTLPDMEHVPEDYGDAPDEHGVPPATYQALERHLPYFLRSGPRDMKLAAMRQVLQGLYPLRTLRDTHQVYRRYRESIESSYQPLHRELYTMNPSAFLVPSFLQAVRISNTEAGFRSIMTEPAPGLFVFSMLQPAFCQMLKAEVDHFRHYWTYVRNQRLMMPTTVMNRNNYGAILCDFGLETVLDNLMKDFLSPIATVLYPELGASSLDSHHSFVVGFAKDQQEGLHVDESEVTLNACINEDFTGGDMYFRGVRCKNHRATPKTQIEENAVYSQTLGQAMLYRGRHRHGALHTLSGCRISFEMWCRSSLSRRMLEHQSDFSSWCGECRGEDN